MTIYNTTEYSKFLRLEGNRDINVSNLKSLKEAIMKNNKLHLHPIIINEGNYVIDGHHRLKVAEELNLPIYYMIDNSDEQVAAYEHIITANVNKKNWSVEDFLHLYATKDKNMHYIEFMEYMDTLDLSVKSLICLIVGPQSPQLIRDMKLGKFQMPQDRIATEKVTMAYFELKEFVMYRKIKPYSLFSNSYFTNAFRMLMLNNSVDVDVFFQKLENRWFNLKPYPNSEEWLKCLFDIYNWKNQNKVELKEAI